MSSVLLVLCDFAAFLIVFETKTGLLYLTKLGAGYKSIASYGTV